MQLEVGAVVEGKVTGITKFGAFVELPGGKTGMVHISEVAPTYVKEIRDYVTENQTVKVKVIGIDENNRINLSIKKAMDPPPRPPRPAGGQSGFAPRPSGPRQGGYAPRQGGGRSGGFSRQPSEPESFEERLKHFMQASDSKLSEMKYTEKRSSRRGGRK